MGKVSHIEWTDSSWNPWLGCTKVSPGCKMCYAERIEERFSRDFSTVRRTSPATFNAPLKWKEPRLVFTASMSDFFHEDADPWRNEAWNIIRRTPQHTYQILTKRPERILNGKKIPDHLPIRMCFHCGNTPAQCYCPTFGAWPWPNVWLGVSVEMQEFMNRASELITIPAVVRFLSCEPLLGPLVLEPWLKYGIHWVITGGESDPTNPRPAKEEWFLDIRDQCKKWNVQFFHKQTGGRKKCSCHNTWGCRLLDGRTYDEMPEVLHDSTLQTETSLP